MTRVLLDPVLHQLADGDPLGSQTLAQVRAGPPPADELDDDHPAE